MDKHIESSTINSVLFSIYQDDGKDILLNGKADQEAYQNHLDSLHLNLKWDLTREKEGGYPDLFLMIKKKREDWVENIHKNSPLYLSRISCHDPKVLKSISKGVGYRIRITNSNNETFRENVELHSRSMALSGYNFNMVKQEMLKFEHIDPHEQAKRPKKTKKSPPGCRAFYVAPFDPRLHHPRKLIWRNYGILAKSEKAKPLFPRANLIASSRRLKNLGEILSLTLQSGPESGRQEQPDLPAGDTGRDRGGGRGRGRGGGRGRGRGAARAGGPHHPNQGMGDPSSLQKWILPLWLSQSAGQM